MKYLVPIICLSGVFAVIILIIGLMQGNIWQAGISAVLIISALCLNQHAQFKEAEKKIMEKKFEHPWMNAVQTQLDPPVPEIMQKHEVYILENNSFDFEGAL